MYIKLKSVQQLAVDGTIRTFYPGDWVDVGKQQAQLWIASGEAEIPDTTRQEFIPRGSGIVIIGRATDQVGDIYRHFDTVISETYTVPYLYTLIWNPSLCELRRELVTVGLGLLDTWDMAVPLYSYDHLAAHFKVPEQERVKTEQAILDMRQPVYEPGQVYVRLGGAGQQVITEFEAIRRSEPGVNIYLAFLRAVWLVKPRINALPVTWWGDQVVTRRRR